MRTKNQNSLIRKSKLRETQIGMMSLLMLLFVLALAVFSGSQSVVRAQGGGPVDDTEYFTTQTMVIDGNSIEKMTIKGPPTPPAGFELQRAAVEVPEPNPALATSTLTVPAFDWVFGCSAVSGSMIAGYYDRNGFPDMYTGPTGGGVTPLDNSVWGTWSDGSDTYPNIPLAASHNGVDGRTTRGSIDDYWVQYGSSTSDPYITGGWTQHTWGDAIGDYMKTSQSAYGNTDGSTTFYTWNTDPSQLTCADMVTNGIQDVDGTYGRKLFYESRGYTVTDCYNQKTDNNGGGFTYAMYKAEIDAGRPVMLNLAGHTIVGVGYNDPSTVYIHDTWDYSTHSMMWGGSYSGMQLLSVSIVNLSGGSTPTVPVLVSPSGTITDRTPTFKWKKVTGATQYRFQVYQGSTLKYTKTVNSSACGTTYCTNTPTTALAYAAHKWRAQAYVGGVWKSYSAFKNFTVSAPATGFNSTFNGSTAGWSSVKGTWTNYLSQYYWTTGVANKWASAKHSNIYGNFTYEARMKRTGETNWSNNIIIRGKPTTLSSTYAWKSSYIFNYTNNGLFSVWRENANGTETALKGWTTSSAIVKNGWNTLKVVANGSSLKFYINNHLVWSGTSTSFLTGQVGLSMYRDAAAGTLTVDWAKLTVITASSANEISEEVFAGQEVPGGDSTQAP